MFGPDNRLGRIDGPIKRMKESDGRIALPEQVAAWRFNQRFHNPVSRTRPALTARFSKLPHTLVYQTFTLALPQSSFAPLGDGHHRTHRQNRVGSPSSADRSFNQ